MKFTDKGKEIENTRVGEAPVDPMFTERWSPRAFSTGELPEEAVRTLFEAARWAPSCFNEQPWLFVYAQGKERAVFEDILTGPNWAWAQKAPLLTVVFARKHFALNGKPNRWASFDCGAAWVSLAFQARKMGLYTHAMAGFSPEKAHELLQVPTDDYQAMAAIATGMYGDREELPEKAKAMEMPNQRKPAGEVAIPFTP